MDLNRYLGPPHTCSCGKIHSSTVKLIDIEREAAARLPGHIRTLGYSHVFIIADCNTWTAAGADVARILKESEIRYSHVILQDKEVIPNEETIGTIMVGYPGGADLVLGIGSGTINDLCKFISYKLGIDYMIYATAPSMDGFVSIGSALMLSHVKTTVDCHGPVAVIGDPAVLAAAPMRLICAGLCDTLGKFTCLLDWKLAHMITGKYYCEEVVSMVQEALKAVSRQAFGISRRDPDAIKSVMEALVLTGIAMSYVGNSRPASGCEHHLSHYWEMIALMSGRTPALHGEQVGVGMLTCLQLYERLSGENIDFEKAGKRSFDRDEWETQIRKYYRDAAPGILALEDKAQKNNVDSRNLRLEAISSQWNEIKEVIRDSLPSYSSVLSLLKTIEAPTTPEEIGITADELQKGILYAKEVRDRYTLLQLLWDLGLSEVYA